MSEKVDVLYKLASDNVNEIIRLSVRESTTALTSLVVVTVYQERLKIIHKSIRRLRYLILPSCFPTGKEFLTY